MNYFDIIIVIPLIWGAYKGYRKGLIIEVASLLALAVGIWGGLKFSSISARYLTPLFDVSDKVMSLISFAVTFIAIVIAVFTLAKILEKGIKIIALGLVNRIAGILFGTLKFLLIVSIVLTIIDSVNTQIEFIDAEKKEASLLYKPCQSVASSIIPSIKNINLGSVFSY